VHFSFTDLQHKSAVPIARLTEFQSSLKRRALWHQKRTSGISNFVEEVINQGQLQRVDDLVAVDFVELDPLPGQQQGREVLKQVINALRTAFPEYPLAEKGKRYLAVLRGMARIAASSLAFLPPTST
jgi:hypothetical protein